MPKVQVKILVLVAIVLSVIATYTLGVVTSEDVALKYAYILAVVGSIIIGAIIGVAGCFFIFSASLTFLVLAAGMPSNELPAILFLAFVVPLIYVTASREIDTYYANNGE